MIELQREACLRVEPGTSVEIACVKGVVWVTQAGDARDWFLAHGESFTPSARGVAIVTALEPALVNVTEHRSAARIGVVLAIARSAARLLLVWTSIRPRATVVRT